MLSSRRLTAAVAALCCAAVCGAASVAAPPAASADTIRDNQQWVLDMINVESAWALTEGPGSPSR